MNPSHELCIRDLHIKFESSSALEHGIERTTSTSLRDCRCECLHDQINNMICSAHYNGMQQVGVFK